jgi:CRP-like cAMP-binding protein
MEKKRQPKASEFQENLEILRQIQFFSGLSLEALKVIAYLCVRETFKPGDYLLHKDDNDGKAFYIVSGKAGVLREDEGGEAPQEKYVEGEFIGSLALLSDMRRLFSLKALTDMTCLILTRDKFAKVMEQFPELMPKILKSVVDGVRAWEERLLIDQDGLCEACRQKAGVSLI